MKSVTQPTQRLNTVKGLKRMDPHYGMDSIMSANYMNQLADFPRDYYPYMDKKYSLPPHHIYNHGYSHATPPQKFHKPTRKKPNRKDDSWFDFNPFGCESEGEDYEGEYSGSEEHTKKTKDKSSKYSKKKKFLLKLLLKLLVGLFVFFAVKCLLSKLAVYLPLFFSTTGRDEIDHDNDQLYHEGLDIERAGGYAKSQDISMSDQTMFSPTYEETNVVFRLPTRVNKSKSFKLRKKKRIFKKRNMNSRIMN